MHSGTRVGVGYNVQIGQGFPDRNQAVSFRLHGPFSHAPYMPSPRSRPEQSEVSRAHAGQLIHDQLHRKLEEIEQSVEWGQEGMNYFGQVRADGL